MNTTLTTMKSLTAMALAAILLVGVSFTTSHAQNYRIGGKQTVMTLYGTSTLHNWEMTAHSFACDAKFDVSPTNDLNGVSGLTLTLPIKNLRSEHDGMNDNAYEALKADEHKDIVFRLTSAKVTTTGAHKHQIVANGNLSIAGVTKAITLTVAAQVNADGSISCSGTVPLKLSDFGIERPSFMLGTMKVGDALTLNYALMLVK